jgi:hypothetical protein
LETVRAGLAGAYSGDEHVLRADTLIRKTGDVAYRLRDLGDRLVFAASRYEEYDRRVRQGIGKNDDEQNGVKRGVSDGENKH